MKHPAKLKKQMNLFMGFNLHLILYLVMNMLIWMVWLSKGGAVRLDIWPVYLGLGWGIALLIHYTRAYRIFQRKNSVE